MLKIDIEEAIEAMNKGRFINHEDAWLLLADKINEIIESLQEKK